MQITDDRRAAAAIVTPASAAAGAPVSDITTCHWTVPVWTHEVMRCGVDSVDRSDCCMISGGHLAVIRTLS